MKKIFLVHFVLFSLLLKIYSQSDYRSGYVILNTSDTLYGYIDFRTDFSNSQHCYFKKDNNSNYIEYFPEQLLGYRFIDGKYYVSKNLRIDNVERKVFLEILIFGKVKIYYSVLEDDPNNLHLSKPRSGRYYIEKDTGIYEINNDIITKQLPDGKTIMRNTNQYKGVLKVFFSDSPDIFKKVNNTSFNKESLINIAKDYHERVCTDEQCIIFEKPLSKRIYKLGITSSYIFQTGDYFSQEYATDIKLKQDSKLSIGLFAATNIDNDYRFWFQVKAMYISHSFTDSLMYRNVYPSSYNYKFSSILTDFTLKYRFSLSKIKPYVFGGLILGSIINNQFKLNTSLNLLTTKIDENAFENKILYGVTAGLGMEYQVVPKFNLFFSLSYDYWTTMRTIQLYGLSLNTGFFF